MVTGSYDQAVRYWKVNVSDNGTISVLLYWASQPPLSVHDKIHLQSIVTVSDAKQIKSKSSSYSSSQLSSSSNGSCSSQSSLASLTSQSQSSIFATIFSSVSSSSSSNSSFSSLESKSELIPLEACLPDALDLLC